MCRAAADAVGLVKRGLRTERSPGWRFTLRYCSPYPAWQLPVSPYEGHHSHERVRHEESCAVHCAGRGDMSFRQDCRLPREHSGCYGNVAFCLGWVSLSGVTLL